MTDSNTAAPPFMLAQTFYADDISVKRAPEVYVSSITLYPKTRPAEKNNSTGVPNPGVEVFLCPTANGVPTQTTIAAEHVARCEYTQLQVSIDAHLGAVFRFPTPVLIDTGKMWAVMIQPDNSEQFTFWGAKAGDVNVETEEKVSSVGFNGQYFELTQGSSIWTPLPGFSLKMDVNICRFWSNGVPVVNGGDVYNYHIDKYEFVDFDTTLSTGQPLGGERVFMVKGSYDGNCSTQAGNASIIASANLSTWYTGTTDPMMIAIESAGDVDVRRILAFNENEALLNEPVSFTNATARFYGPVPTAKLFTWVSSNTVDASKKTVILSESTANSSVKFSNNCTIRGEQSNATFANCQFFNMLTSESDARLQLPVHSGTSYSARQYIGWTTPDEGATWSGLTKSYPITMFEATKIPAPPTILLSRSNEVSSNATYSTKDNSNNSWIEVTVTSDNDFVMPTLPIATFPTYFTRYYINNDYTNEHTKYGAAISKGVSKRISLGADTFAEDMIVYMNAYRPLGTDLKVYVKMLHSSDPDAFDDKDWTLLECTGNQNKYSSSSDESGVIEYTYTLPMCPNTQFTFDTTVTVVNASSTIDAASAAFAANIAAGDLVKIYDPLFPNTNFFVASVTTVTNTSQIIIDQSFSNNSLLGVGKKIDKIGYPNQVFRNNQKTNISRYYDSTGAYHDTYNSFAVKVVFLSNSQFNVPYVSSTRAIAVTA